MTTTVEQGAAIAAGYRWKLQIETSAAAFPSGVAITGHVRRKASDATVLATLSTADNSITRISDTVIEIALPGDVSKDWAPGDVIFDLVRTDVDPDAYLGFTVKVPVIKPVTRDLP